MHHDIHTLRFIHDDTTVVFPCRRIVRKSLIESLRVALDQRDRCLQLVGDIGDKLLLARRDLRFVLNIRL